jgi:ATP-dependent exoDNAse (exonuclease V) alpha subunit
MSDYYLLPHSAITLVRSHSNTSTATKIQNSSTERSTLSLNTLQQQAFNRVVIDKAPITFLCGSAGTGKTYTIASIIAHYPHCILTASSHQAKTVISQMTGREATTTHKYFGYILKKHNYKQILCKRDNYTPDLTTLLVIDEISMLPNVILREAIKQVGTLYRQLLIIGDAIQLPAVLNPPDMSLLEPYRIELTQQMRQDACPSLQSYLSMYRTAITDSTEPSSLFAEVPAITLVDSHAEFCRQYITTHGNKKIIAYRNTVVDKYNSSIHTGDNFNVGDTVIIDKPIQDHANNQDTVLILAIADREHYYELIVRCDNGYTTSIRHYKSTSYLNKQLNELKSAGREVAYWSLYDISFRLKHVYACTIHKSQGSSVDYIFIDALDFINAYQAEKTRYNNPISLDLFLRLMYVAISRMRIHCYIYTGNDMKGRTYDTLLEPYDKAIKGLSKPRPIPKPIPKRWSIDD